MIALFYEPPGSLRSAKAVNFGNFVQEANVSYNRVDGR